MKKVIDGLRYDTEKAVEVGSADNLRRGANSVTDFKFWEATLYRTTSGKYFLAGEGGPMTEFAKEISEYGRGYGKGIIPLSRKEALDWAEENLPVEVTEKEFDSLITDA